MKKYLKHIWDSFCEIETKVQILIIGIFLFCVVIGMTIGISYAFVVIFTFSIFAFSGGSDKDDEQNKNWGLSFLKGTKINKFFNRDEEARGQLIEQVKNLEEEINLIEEHIADNPADLQAKLLLKEKKTELDKLK
ncbi:hypothetical protein [Bacillus bombysepticus]|uniref:hypothetical protein n=1 Tax=Bacillus bombysepticus TaxID=658666 RepID=UPI00301820C2